MKQLLNEYIYKSDKGFYNYSLKKNREEERMTFPHSMTNNKIGLSNI